MVRTQVQFTEKQTNALRQLSSRQKKSMADLVREGVDMLLREQERMTAIHRALNAPTFRSGKRDISENHDEYLAEAYANRDD